MAAAGLAERCPIELAPEDVVLGVLLSEDADLRGMWVDLNTSSLELLLIEEKYKGRKKERTRTQILQLSSLTSTLVTGGDLTAMRTAPQ